MRGVTYRRPTRPATNQTRIRTIRVACLLVVIAATAAALGHQLPASSSSAAPWSSTAAPPDVPLSEHRGAPGEADGAVPDGASVSEHHGGLGEADGLVPDGASVFDDETPAVANLDPSLLDALRRAATDAAADGIEIRVNSGWRSPEYQEQLLREAV